MNKTFIIAICTLLATTQAFELIGPMRKVTGEDGLTTVERHGRLIAENGKVVNQYGAIPQLNGMSMFWSQWMGKYWNADAINWLVSDWKVQVIRAAMGVPMGGYLEHPDVEKGKMVAVIDAAIKNGIYVICDWHIEGQNKDNVDRAKGFFAEMSQKYGSNEHVLWEGWNEPTQQDWSSEIKPYHQQVLQTIRQNSQTLYIAGSGTWSQDADKACGDKISGTNVAYTLHFYAASHGGELRSRAENAMNNGCALFITEWGTCEASGNGRVDTGSAQQWLDWAKSHGIGTANWGVEDKPESCAALNPNASATGGWSTGDLTQSGNFVRSYLRGEKPGPGPGPGPTPSGGCCSWDGGNSCRSFRDWCDGAPENCRQCKGGWKPNSPSPSGKGCCSWGGNCRAWRDWCDEAPENCNGKCKGSWKPQFWMN